MCDRCLYPECNSQLCSTQMTVNGCEEQHRADGRENTQHVSALSVIHSPAITHSLQCDLCLQRGAAERGFYLQPALKDKTQHLSER